ncbi:hypothetical protein BJ508DRAFT_380760 [Ascobolus immersus RN42]|uniref:Uncharacterized protein n=1 Tax=Ascobolus immersus RN42 TaxID=1160509 RepID=A0A3N4HQJ0_ASCIM|nr:hypothetical protein BJ508DRAFT_380760 [Ascobolus immersus RN42]
MASDTPSYVYTVLSITKELRDDIVYDDQSTEFYEEQGLTAGTLLHGAYASAVDANTAAKKLLLAVYRGREGKDFVERWTDDNYDTITYKEGCFTMLEHPEEEDEDQLRYPFIVTVNKLAIKPDSKLKTSNSTTSLKRPADQATVSSEPPSKRITKAANPKEVVAAGPVFRTIEVYKFTTEKSYEGKNKYHDRSETDGVEEEYYLSKENAIEALKSEVEMHPGDPMSFGQNPENDIDYDDEGLPSWMCEWDEDYIETKMKIEKETVKVAITKEKRWNGKGVETEDGDMWFADWDGTVRGYNRVFPGPGALKE